MYDMMPKIILFILTFLVVHLDAQRYQLADVEVLHGTDRLDIAMAGGLRAPQFSQMDLDLDGREDLVIFDREGDIIIPLLHVDAGYIYAPEYRDLFPAVRQWMRLVDYNGDGVKDLFCAPISIGIPGVEIHKGIIEGDSLRFEQLLFPQNTADILFYPLGSSRSQVYVSTADQPDVRDIDGDGDIDILAFEPSGSSVFYYKNLTIENNLDPDDFIVRLEDQCFGGFIESGFSQDVSLSPSAGDCATFFRSPDEISARSRHAGSTVTAMDVTGNGLSDVLLGDIAYNGIVKLTNGGNERLAWMVDQETKFPEASDQPIEIELFLSTFYEDVDEDGTAELIVSTNDRSGAQGRNHIWLYDRITQEGARDQYLLKNKNYLVDEMIYTGTMSAPMFFDADGDGLTDLLIGTSGKSPDGISIDPRMILYKNVGSKAVPRYVLEDNDYLGMSEFATTSRHFAPAIGDVDGDGDLDMVIGDDSGRLYYVANNSNNSKELRFRRPVFDPWGIRVSAWAKPAIFDHNGDGLGDLVIGEQNFNSANGLRGSFNYFENQGTPNTPFFDPNETTSPNEAVWGGVSMKEPGFISNYSSPVIANLGDRNVLISSNEKGTVYLYDSLRYEDNVTFELISSTLGSISEGTNGALALADIDDDQLLEIAVGTRRGGIAIFDTDIKVDLKSNTKPILEKSEISIGPNPTTDVVTLALSSKTCDACAMTLIDAQGRTVLRQLWDGNDTSINLSSLSAGLYILNIESIDFQAVSQIIKLNAKQ